MSVFNWVYVEKSLANYHLLFYLFYTASRLFWNWGCTFNHKWKEKDSKRYQRVSVGLFCQFTTAVTKINAAQVLLRSADILVGRLTGDGSLLVCVCAHWGVLYSAAWCQGLSCCYGDSTVTLTKCEITHWSGSPSRKALTKLWPLALWGK